MDQTAICRKRCRCSAVLLHRRKSVLVAAMIQLVMAMLLLNSATADNQQQHLRRRQLQDAPDATQQTMVVGDTLEQHDHDHTNPEDEATRDSLLKKEVAERGGGDFQDSLNSLHEDLMAARDKLTKHQKSLLEFLDGIEQKALMADNPKKGLKSMFAGMIEEMNWGTLVCDATQSVPCAYNAKGDQGVFVCRRVINPFSGAPQESTICANPTTTNTDLDECGCCGGVCPSPCACGCEMADGSSGVRVTATIDPYGFPMEYETCQQQAVAASWIGEIGETSMSCTTDCSAPFNDFYPILPDSSAPADEIPKIDSINVEQESEDDGEDSDLGLGEGDGDEDTASGGGYP